MSKKTLPANCRIELCDYDRKERPFRLIFEAKNGDDYRSEVYYPEKGQRTKAAAWEICRRYGWLDFPPATGVLTKEEIEKLRDLVDGAIFDMESNPARYVPDPDKFWRELFDWADSDQEFFMDGNDLLACGDPPVQEPDCDRESGWAEYSYTHDIGRYIPAAVKNGEVKSGPRGIETVTFHSGDSDGDWEVEAFFCRHQPGAKITEEDQQRYLAAKKVADAAWEAYRAADKDAENYRDLHDAHRVAASALEIAKQIHGDIDEECWDPEDFQYYATQMNCYWTLLRYKRYEIWCALNGEDPSGNVMPEYEKVAAVFEVTVRQRGDGHRKITTKRVSGREDLEKEAIDYVDGYTLEELKEIIRENPKGRPIKADLYGQLRKGWKPVKVTMAEATIRVEIKGSRAIPITPQRIRAVSCRGLQEDVLRMLHQIDKHFPI